MNEKLNNFIKNVAEMRSKVIASGGKPTTLAVSKQHIEAHTLFGLKIKVVESEQLPKSVVFAVYGERGLSNEREAR